MPTAPVMPASPVPVGISIKRSARVRRAAAGSYRGPGAADGINNVSAAIEVRYDGHKDAIAVINAFVLERAGLYPFYFPFAAGSPLVRCPDWSGPDTAKGLRRRMTLRLVEDHSAGYTPEDE